MNAMQLTDPAKAANISATQGLELLRRRISLPMMGAIVLSAVLGACISVKAPDKPIVIELNVNIRQEVIYRLAADAGNTIDENEDIF